MAIFLSLSAVSMAKSQVRSRAIVAARAGDRLQRVAAHVFGERALGEKAEPGAAADHHAALQEVFRRHRADQALGNGSGCAMKPQCQVPIAQFLVVCVHT